MTKNSRTFRVYVYAFVSLLVLVDWTLQYDVACQNDELIKLGCQCYSSSLTTAYLLPNCPLNMEHDLKCIFQTDLIHTNDSSSQPFVNFFDEAIVNLIYLKLGCWRSLNFANVVQVTRRSFADIKFLRDFDFNEPLSDIYLTFQNTFSVDSFAFESINLDRLIIEFDSPFRFVERKKPHHHDKYIHDQKDNVGDDGDTAAFLNQLVLQPFAFANIRNCKRLGLRNFISSDASLMLRPSLFSNSTIQTLFIEFSTFKGFASQDFYDCNTIVIQAIIIDQCFIETIESDTIAPFAQLEQLTITRSGVSGLTNDSFSACCTYLRVLDLSGNQLQFVNASFDSLVNLELLDLSYNPIEYVVFDELSNLLKLNLASTNVKYLSDIEFPLSLDELILTRTRLDADNAQQLARLTNLKSLRLSNIQTSMSLNQILETFLLVDNEFANLTYLDLDVFNSTDFLLESERIEQALWNSSLIEHTFVRVNRNSPCNCPLFLLYKNIENYSFPYDNSNADQFINFWFRYESTKQDLETTKRFLDLMPICYRNLWFKGQSSRAEIYRLELECIYQLNKTTTASTTTTTTTTTTSTTITSITTTANSSNITSDTTSSINTSLMSSSSTTKPANFMTTSNEDINTTREIGSPGLIIIGICVVFLVTLFIIGLIVYKTKHEFTTTGRLVRNFHRSFSIAPQPREMENIYSISNPFLDSSSDEESVADRL